MMKMHNRLMNIPEGILGFFLSRIIANFMYVRRGEKRFDPAEVMDRYKKNSLDLFRSKT